MRPSFIAGSTVVLLAALMPPAVASGAEPTSVSAPAAANMAAARELVDVLQDQRQLEGQIDQMLATMITQLFTANADMAALNTEYPGVDKLFSDTMRPILLDELTKIVPEYKADMASFFASSFTVAELGELTGFWRSPAGQAALNAVSGSVDFSAISKEVVGQMDDPDNVRISQSAIAEDIQNAARSGIGSLSPAHRAAILRFGLQPTGRKMTRLMPGKLEIEQRWANRDFSPEATARMEEEIATALITFIEAEDEKRAAAR